MWWCNGGKWMWMCRVRKLGSERVGSGKSEGLGSNCMNCMFVFF